MKKAKIQKFSYKVPERPNFHQWAGSCCNISNTAIGDDTALLTFSDFYIPDENGVKHNGIKTIKIIAKK